MTTKLTDEQKAHVFDPIHNGADECECGLTENADIHESDDAYEERMRPRIVNAPGRIWLQVGCDNEAGEIDWKDLSHPDVSWCDERIDNTDIEYVRADLSPVVDVDAKWDKSGLKEACQRALKLDRTHQEMDTQLVLDMLLEIERLGSALTAAVDKQRS